LPAVAGSLLQRATGCGRIRGAALVRAAAAAQPAKLRSLSRRSGGLPDRRVLVLEHEPAAAEIAEDEREEAFLSHRRLAGWRLAVIEVQQRDTDPVGLVE